MVGVPLILFPIAFKFIIFISFQFQVQRYSEICQLLKVFGKRYETYLKKVTWITKLSRSFDVSFQGKYERIGRQVLWHRRIYRLQGRRGGSIAYDIPKWLSYHQGLGYGYRLLPLGFSKWWGKARLRCLTGSVESKIGCNFSSETGTVDGWKVK